MKIRSLRFKEKRIAHLLTLLVILCMMMPIFPVPVHAASSGAPSIRINGEVLNNTYRYLVSEKAAKSGTLGVNNCTAYYIPDTGVLELSDYRLGAISVIPTGEAHDLNIKLNGYNTVTADKSENEFVDVIAIRNDTGGNLDITAIGETARLIVTAKATETDGSVGMSSGRVNISGNVFVTVIAKTEAVNKWPVCGINADASFTLEGNADLEVIAQGTQATGILATGDITFNTTRNIKLEAIGDYRYSRPILNENYRIFLNQVARRMELIWTSSGVPIDATKIPLPFISADPYFFIWDQIKGTDQMVYFYEVNRQNTYLSDVSIACGEGGGKLKYQLDFEFNPSREEYFINRSTVDRLMQLNITRKHKEQLITATIDGENALLTVGGDKFKSDIIPFKGVFTQVNITVTSPDRTKQAVYKFKITKGREGTIRLAGSNRFGTAAEISKFGWDTSDLVILARANDFADSIAGVGLSKSLDAPILLANTHNFNATTEAEFKRLGAKGVVILGGTMAISQQVEDQIKSKGFQVVRVAGKNRYETATMIAQIVLDDSTTSLPVEGAMIVFGGNFPDALAVAPAAAKNGYPVLMVKTKEVPVETKNFLRKNGINTIIVVGGNGVISDQVLKELPGATRLAGKNRYETAVEIAKVSDSSCNSLFIASGTSFSDSLTLAALAAKYNESLLIVDKDIIPNAVSTFIQSKIGTIDQFFIAGGEGVISKNIEQKLENYLK